MEIETTKPATKRENLKDHENYMGEDYEANPELANGPLFDRKCTDLICLAVFIICIYLYGWTMMFAWQNS